MSSRFSGLFALFLLLTGSLSGCGYNNLQAQDEAVQAAWSEVVNQYQRRADLVPNLVSTVQGYAAQEKDVLTQVTEARASVGKVQVTPDMVNNPAALNQFASAQGDLSNALSRLLVVSENYPTLKSDTLFRDLSAQLEGTENRITVARNRYIEQVQTFNTTVRQFPENLTAKVIGMKPKANFSVENEAGISVAPKVNFNQTPAPATAPAGH
jgi:LemA protein